MRTLVGIVAVFVLAACAGDGGGGDGAGAVTTTTPTSTGGVPALCVDLVGTPTAAVTADAQCTTDAGGVELLAFFFYDCPDGRRLSWNDHGWGYSDGPWQAHARADGQLVPPDADLAACPGG
jgi:hypothetical protein